MKRSFFCALIATLVIAGTAFSQVPVINPITGPANVCWSTAPNTYSASASNSPTIFFWSVVPSVSVQILNQDSSATPINFSNNNGTYTVYCQASNSSGSSATTSFVVNVYQKVNVTFSGNNIICQGSSTFMSASPTMIQASSTINSGSSTLYYTWSPPTGLDTTIGPDVTANPTITTTYTVSVVNGPCTNTAVTTVSVDACVGIVKHEAALNVINVYPNPCAGKLVIDHPAWNNGETTLYITNALGQAVLSDRIKTPQSEYDLSALKRGLYFVMLQQGTEVRTIKLLKE